MFLTSPIPCAELRRLEFLVGEFDGAETIYDPEQPPVRLQSHAESTWEASERYLRLESFSYSSPTAYDSVLAMIGYDSGQGIYRMWSFARSLPEPMFLAGTFVGDGLVLVGEPSPMAMGTQRMRYTVSPVGEDGYEYLGEYWTPEGWQKYTTGRMNRSA